MSRGAPIRVWLTFSLLAAAALPNASSASANTLASAGGSSYEPPEITALKCNTGSPAACSRGELLRLSGEGLAKTTAVTFLGGPGARDNRTVAPRRRSPRRLLVVVPPGARSGPVVAVTPAAVASGPKLEVHKAKADISMAPMQAAAAVDNGVFPIIGEHEYGTEVNRFGGGRNHQGQDVLAACGLPLVSALAGVVTTARFHQRAGYYVVVQADDGTSQAYMHLLAPTTVQPGQRVAAGQSIGQVGQTGQASACHLHFELWNGGWHTDGTPVDPLPALQRWDAAS